MRIPPPTIASEWAEWATENAEGMSPANAEELRHVFFDGFFSALTIAMELTATDGIKRKRMLVLKRLFEEVRANRGATP